MPILLNSVDRIEFTKHLYEVLNPSVPVDSIELLFGREKELEDIEYSLHARGRHCFIYGDRGIGKSSLAHTVATQLQSSEKRHLRAECHPNSTFVSVINSLVSYANKQSPLHKIEKHSKSSAKLSGFSYEQGEKTLIAHSLSSTATVDEALDLFRDIATTYSENTIAVVDEFDAITDQKELSKFGEFLKYLGDLDIDVTLIFTGIGKSLEDLLGGHLSSARQLHQVNLEPLNWTGRYDIIDKAFSTFGVSIADDFRFKIAGLSDGFPHYVHLLCEKILIEMHKLGGEYQEVTREIFLAGLDDAINSIGEHIKRDYVNATEGRDEHFHHLLWAMADSADLIRSAEHIKFSYHEISKSMVAQSLTDDEFKKHFAKLRGERFGNIIVRGLGKRTGWFKFRENMVRGFIRMYAERNDITLDFERHYTANTASAKATHTYRAYRPLTSVESNVAKLRNDKVGA